MRSDALAHKRRIAVLGSCGSGKTHLARELATRTGLPLIHLDDLYWRPGWSRTEPEAWRTIVEDVASRPEWIIDGNYASSLEPRLSRADFAIYLDMPTSTCLARVIRRDLQRELGTAEVPVGVRGTRRQTVRARLAFWWHVFRFAETHRPKTLAMIERHRVPAVILRSNTEVNTWLGR